MISPFLDHWLESRSVFGLDHWLYLDPFGPLINFYCLDRCFSPDAVVQFPGKLHVCFLLYLLGPLKYIPMLREWTPPRSLLRWCEWFGTGRGTGRIRFSINGLTATDREWIAIVLELCPPCLCHWCCMCLIIRRWTKHKHLPLMDQWLSVANWRCWANSIVK